jgi:peptide/nickel transport system ATP-binding protein
MTDTVTGSPAPVLRASELTKWFPAGRQRGRRGGRRFVRAVEKADLALAAGEIVALVGESGSGKTTLGRLMTRLEVPTSGDLRLNGQPVPRRGVSALRPFRKQVQVVFQDPYGSLNTMRTVGYHLVRPLLIHQIASSRAEARRRAIELLERVHLTPGEEFIDRHPGQLSGGQRQRVAIARALACNPQVVVADEPVASLDVSSRLSILNLFAEIARDGASILYITHDIASARYFADRVVVMYAGRIVEEGPAEDVVSAPFHPYTRLLIDSAPDPDRRDADRRLPARGEEVASLITPPSGCRFHPRCPHALTVCDREAPPVSSPSPHRSTACWLYSSDQPQQIELTTSPAGQADRRHERDSR